MTDKAPAIDFGSWLRNTLIVSGSVGVGIGLHLLLQRWIGGGFTFLPFLFSVVIAAWVGNGGAGIVTSALAAMAVALLAFEPVGSLAVINGYDQLRLLLFLLLAFSISAACARLHYARRQVLAHSLKAERARADSEDLHRRFQTALEAGLVTLWDWDLDTNQIIRSESAKAMYGLEGEPIEKFFALMHPADRPALEAAIRAAIETDAGYEREFRVRGADDTWIWMASRGGIRRDLVTGHRHLAGSALDISELARTREAMRESEHGLQQMADSIPQLAWTARPDGSIEWFNRRWLDYTGVSREQFVEYGWQLLVEPSMLHTVVQAWSSAIEARSPLELTFPVRGMDGGFRPLLMKVLPLIDEEGEVLRWFGTHTDIGNQVALEVQRREEDRRIDVFLASLAHELRNPLAPLRNGLEALRRLDPVDESWRRAHSMMDRQLSYLGRLLDDLLDVARIRHGKLDIKQEKIALSKALSFAIESVEPMIDAAGQKLVLLELDDDMDVEGDSTRLSQAFEALLNNASKFSPPKATITVEVRKAGFQAEICVRDTGAGIAAGDQPFVFDLFWQTPVERPIPRRGLGLGLALTRNIVEMHGGKVLVESRGIGQGSSFTVRLPLAVKAKEQTEEARSAAQPAGGRVTVLVVDDNRDAAESLAQLIHLEGHDALLAYGGREALALAEVHRPQLGIFDIGMPEMDGYELCRRLRMQPAGAGMLIAALTGWGQPEDRQRAFSAGYNAYFVKPMDPTQLVGLLQSVCAPNGSSSAQDLTNALAAATRSLVMDVSRPRQGAHLSFDGTDSFPGQRDDGKESAA